MLVHVWSPLTRLVETDSWASHSKILISQVWSRSVRLHCLQIPRRCCRCWLLDNILCSFRSNAFCQQIAERYKLTKLRYFVLVLILLMYHLHIGYLIWSAYSPYEEERVRDFVSVLFIHLVTHSFNTYVLGCC